MKLNRTVALLPIKKNSTRVSGKNFKNFSGKPLFFWILETLLSLPWIDLIVINTDAREVLINSGLTLSKKVLIRDREEHIKGDDVSMNRVIENDINHVPADTYLMTHTTNPLISGVTLTNAAKQYQKCIQAKKNDSLFSVTQIQQRIYSKETGPINHDPKNLIPTQHLPKWFIENSCFYFFSRQSFSKTSSRIGQTPFLYPSPQAESIDIDDVDSWHLAAQLHQNR